jgi:tRNA threonylcarbamoyladenosine biosynthesis protein TsaE
MPILDPHTLEFVSRSADQTRRLGLRLGALLEPGDVICLEGDLGSGKTTLMQGIAQGWGSLDPVSSPTFVLINVYHRPDKLCLYHLDAYRLQDSLEAEDLDLDPMLETGILVVEWAGRISDALPAGRLTIQMRWLADEQRGMVFLPHGPRHEAFLTEFRRRTFGG